MMSLVASGGHEDISLVGSVFHGHYLASLPSSRPAGALIGSISVTQTWADRRAQLGGPLAHVAIASHQATLPAIITSVARLMPSTSDSRQPVQIVELGLGRRVVDVDRAEQQRALGPTFRSGGVRRWWSLRSRP